MSSNFKVSVFCLAYNHEKYIRNALEGFVMQKTNFPFEVLIHDDASTDGTADIIREYEQKYPHIIKPIYQSENQYSKGVRITRTFLLPKAKGEYFAWCEGDDCWTDPHKLQKQVDFLDKNLEYSVCAHRVKFRDLIHNTVYNIPNMSEERDFSADEIIRGGALFHITSIVIRADLYRAMPTEFLTKWFSDIQLYIYGAICGKFRVLNDVMSAYNHGVAGSWTMSSKNDERRVNHTQQKIKVFSDVNKFYNYKYDDAFSFAINREYFNLCVLNGDKKGMKKPEYRQFYKKYKRNKKVEFLMIYFPFVIKTKNFFKRFRQIT